MNKSKLTMIRKQNGMSLLEIIIVLGIIGTIAAGVVVLAQRALDNKSIADLNSNINATRLALTATFRTSGYPVSTDIAASLIPSALEDPASLTGNAGLDPAAQLFRVGAISSSELTNPITGNIFHISSLGNTGTTEETVAGANGKVFTIAVSGLSSKQCSQVAMTQSAQWDFVEVILADTIDAIPTVEMTSLKSVQALRTLDPTGRLIPSLVEIATACSASLNTVVFASR
ncbi:type II secretion system GspH family protein [Shewanella sp. D64]|uniref:type II secretion system protein n=1 Tax=unclassified Shewanella TaxID=196818 RepID=UPI0022BA6C7A|nr:MULTISPECIES: type II secretion system protein [unclassified Shewanella]MEC4724930.1 type II secretion system GspH family protein [Shewanella sp. D64]MEC4736277.1 type II secretion system GspH family protein [Shewanella sp. E94]WBJ97659.1 type II secretion system GspH family protein [Shewanella sp. MTB7]